MLQLPKIRLISMDEQRFNTIGDWGRSESGEYFITIAMLPDYRHQVLVLIHELVEWTICMATGVSVEAADAFDELWEQELRQGKQPPEEEAGFDLRCPYRRGHIWGARAERFFAWLFRVDWKAYCNECEAYCIILEGVMRAK